MTAIATWLLSVEKVRENVSSHNSYKVNHIYSVLVFY